jgi:hypothetical protein
MKFLYNYFHSIYLFMRKAQIRHGAEFWMLPFVLLTWSLPVNLLLTFFLPESLIWKLFLCEVLVAMTLGLIVSLIPHTRRFLSKHYPYQSVTGEKKLTFWNYVSNYAVILITINHPILLMMLLLLFGELK